MYVHLGVIVNSKILECIKLTNHSESMNTYLLEVNAGPDLSQAGTRLGSYIDDLIDGMHKLGVCRQKLGMWWMVVCSVLYA